MKRANLFGTKFEYDESDPDGYRAGGVNLSRIAGGQAQTVKLYEIPPGQSSCPYHYEYEEEWLAVLEGTLALRTRRAKRRLSAGRWCVLRPVAAAPTR